jgi:hypothetical protein
VEAKWAKTTIAAGGIFLGTILLFGVLEPNQSVVDSRDFRSARALTAENDILRQQIGLISPRLNQLEIQTVQLREHANEFHKLLRRSTIVRDTVFSIANAAQRSKIQASLAAVKNPLP